MSDEEGSDTGEREVSEGENPQEESQDKDDDDDKEVSYGMYQCFVFGSLFIGHCLYLYNHRVFQFVLPHIMNERTMSGMDVTAIIMIQQIATAISAFFASVHLDKGKARPLFASGMFFVGFFNFGFSDIEEPPNLMLFAALNGFGQGLGWPCCVKVMRQWFPKDSFGFWWAMLSQSFFVVGLVGPTVSNSWANDYGWRVAIQMPAVISMVVAIALYFTVFDKPSDVAHIDQYFPGEDSRAKWQDILACEFMLLLCTAGFLLNMIKRSTLDWGQLFLMDERSVSTYNAGLFSTFMEFGGALGTTIMGAVADFAIAKNMHIGYYHHPRMILLFASLFGGGLVMSSMVLTIDAYSNSSQVNMFAFFMGFAFSAAIQNIEALVVETAPPNRLGSCFGLVNFSTNAAAVIAGFPISFLAASYGWGKTFFFLNFALMVSFFVVIIGKDLDQTFIPHNERKAR